MPVLLKGIAEIDGKLRLDVYISEVLKVLSRSQLKNRFIKALVNEKTAKVSKLIKNGDSYLVELKEEEDISSANQPEEISLKIIYEDKNVIVVDKPQGMVVHPAHANWSGTLANALLWYFRAESSVPPRAGLVHRLDKDTSGLIIAAKNVLTQEYLAAQFRNRSVKKTYIAITKGIPEQNYGSIDNNLARDPKNRKLFAVVPTINARQKTTGKRAVSEWEVVAKVQNYAFLSLNLKTGRTHQLRVHCKAILCPILGDPLYGKKDKLFPSATLMLHAYRLSIKLPGSDKETEFTATIPGRFETIADKLGLNGLPWS